MRERSAYDEKKFCKKQLLVRKNRRVPFVDANEGLSSNGVSNDVYCETWALMEIVGIVVCCIHRIERKF